MTLSQRLPKPIDSARHRVRRRLTAPRPWFLRRRSEKDKRLLQLLAFGLVPDEEQARQILDDVEQVRADWLRAHGDGDVSDREITTLLEGALSRSVAEQIEGNPLLLGLTSGFDSRPLLYALRHIGREPRLYTWSQPGNIDYDIVRWLDDQLSLGVTYCDTRTLEFSLGAYERYARSQNPAPIGLAAPGSEWALSRFSHGTQVHGFANDVLTGDNREKVAGTEHIESAEDAFTRRNDHFGAQALFDAESLRSLRPGEAVSPSRSLDEYRQYDLAYRQFGRIRPLPGGPLDIITPFTDRRWMGFWLSRPAEDRQGQRRWLRWVVNLQSELFADLHSLEHLDGKELEQARKRRFYGTRKDAGLLDLSRERLPIQPQPSVPFDIATVYATNPSLQRVFSEGLRRLRGRNLFYPSVVDDVERSLKAFDPVGAKLAAGLLTVDVHLEVGAL